MGLEAVLESFHGVLANLSREVAHVLEEYGQDLLGVRGEVLAHGLCHLEDVAESGDLSLKLGNVAVELGHVLLAEHLEREALLGTGSLALSLTLSDRLEVDLGLELRILQDDLEVLGSDVVEVGT